MAPKTIPEVHHDDKPKKKQSQVAPSILDIQKENKKLETLISDMQKRRDRSQSSLLSPSVKSNIDKAKEYKEKNPTLQKPEPKKPAPRPTNKDVDKLNQILSSNKEQKQKEEERTTRRLKQAKGDKDAHNMSLMSTKSLHNKSTERVREMAECDKKKLNDARSKRQLEEIQLREAVVGARKEAEVSISKSVTRMKQQKFEAALKIKREKEQLKEKMSENQMNTKAKFRQQKLLVI